MQKQTQNQNLYASPEEYIATGNPLPEKASELFKRVNHFFGHDIQKVSAHNKCQKYECTKCGWKLNVFHHRINSIYPDGREFNQNVVTLTTPECKIVENFMTPQA